MSHDFKISTDRRVSLPRGSSRHKPALLGLLRSLGLDVAYHRAAGNCVYYRDDRGDEIEVLDLVAGYGTLLLGHAHPQLVAEAMQFLSGGRPNHVQGSVRSLAARLADELSARAERDDCVVFANSGAEAVEAAMKHAMLETGGRTFLALEGGFHGKTLGAVQLTATPSMREPFAIPGLKVIRISPRDIDRLEADFQRADDLAGLLFEPILGEGGVRPLDPAFIGRVAELCADRDIPLIADECQTGLGRTGSFLASSALGVRPDYMILSKALGGGLAKISAVLIDRRRYQPAFDLLHTSTFADDDFSCAIALKTLELLDSRRIDACREKGARLLERLRLLQCKYPGAVAEVRGRGLMLGIELQPHPDSPSFLFRALTARELLGPLVAGYLLKRHRVRVAPTLSDPLTLRVQPSALISDDHLDRFVDALDETCARLARNDVRGLTAHLSDRTEVRGVAAYGGLLTRQSYVEFRPRRPNRRHDSVPRRSIAWLFHLIDADDLPSFEPEFASCAPSERVTFLNRLAPLAEPVVMPSVDIRSRRGGVVRVFPLLLPVTSAWMKHAVAARQFSTVRALVQQSIETARDLGCELVSLGQFTSIVSGNGRALDGQGLGITTGNSYTTALVIDAVRAAQADRGFVSADSTIAVVGAGGNIGRSCAEILGPEFDRVILIGRDAPASRQHVREVARRIPRAEFSCDVRDVRLADVIVCATNGIDPVLVPADFRQSAIVCDAALPRAVHSDTARRRPDVHVIHGGVARLPFGEDLGVPGFPLPAGQAFGCMVEGILLCLESIRDTSFTGRLCSERIQQIAEIAKRHGFEPMASPPDLMVPAVTIP
ncbi:MAG: aminotransferase class III-fold pyridoxal phosphate-dependent enzyme [Planctomycetaceae bacterium]